MKHLKFILFLFLVLESGNSCEKNNTGASGELMKFNAINYDNCGCSSDKINELTDFHAKLYFKIDSNFYNQENFKIVVFNSNSKNCSMIVKNGNMISYGKICNYPLELDSLKFDNGAEVILSGNTFNPCINIISPSIYTYADIILTKFQYGNLTKF